ncbi:MAG: efflux RND transporter periplasmic adaptor subunit [Gammaproteobacteria bacterium]
MNSELRTRWRYWLGALVLIELLGGNAWAQGKGGGGMPVIAATVETRELVDQLKAIGTLEAEAAAEIRPEVVGIVREIDFKEGQRVEQGEVLAIIDDSVYQAELAKAKAEYELARVSSRRNEALRRTGVTSAQQIDEAAANLGVSKASLDLAQIRLDKTRVRAPFSGIAGFRNVSAGDYADSSSILTQVVQTDPIKVEFDVAERYLSSLDIGKTVDIKVDAWPETNFQGKLYAIDPQVDPDTRTIRVKAIIDNPDGKLLPGMFAYVEMVAASRPNALVIPEEAVIPTPQGAVVMKVVDGKAAMASVTLGLRLAGEVEVISGLQVGDQVITAGYQKVGPGSPVTVLPPAAAPSEESSAAGDAAPAAKTGD